MIGDGMAGLLGRRLRESGQGPEARVTVAELHRVLLPYALCREELGFATKAEYDLALLGLLAEDRRVKVVEDRLATAVERELDTPEPGLAFLRDFAASELRLRFAGEAGAAGEVAGANGDAPAGRDAAGGAAGAVSAGPEVAPGDPATAGGGEARDGSAGRGRDEPASTASWLRTLEGADLEAPEPAAADDAEAGSAGAEGGSAGADGPRVATSEDEAVARTAADPDAPPEAECCWCCRATLPERSGLAFCPYCGTDQRAARCEKCGEMLEDSWSFCPRCGEEAGRA